MRAEKWRRYTPPRKKETRPQHPDPDSVCNNQQQNGKEPFSSDSALLPAPDRSTQRAALPSAHGRHPPTPHLPEVLLPLHGWGVVGGEWLQVRAPADALESPGGDNPQPGCARRPLSALEKQPQFKTIPHPPPAPCHRLSFKPSNAE